MDRIQLAENQLGWPPWPPIPRRFVRRPRRADEILVEYVLDGVTGARRQLAQLLDKIAYDARLPATDRTFRVALFYRCGVANNWVGVLDGDRDRLDRALGLLNLGLTLAVPGSVESARLQLARSNTLINRYARFGDPADFDGAMLAARQSMADAEGDPLVRDLARSGLSHVLRVRFRESGNRHDLYEAIDLAEAAAAQPDVPAALRARLLITLEDLLSVRYEITGAIADLDRAIAIVRVVNDIQTPLSFVDRSAQAGTLGALLRNRYLRLRNPQDLDEAIELLAAESADGRSDDPARLTNLGNGLLTRFEARGDVDDLQLALTVQLKSVERTDRGDWQLATRHNNLANALSVAARTFGDRHFADRALNHRRIALALTGDDAPERTSRELNLASEMETGDDAARAEATRTYRAAVQHGMDGSLEWGLAAASRWGRWASERGAWAEAAEAFQLAIDVVQRLFRVQLLRREREIWLSQSQGLAASAAAALARIGRLRDAVVAIEEGSGLLLSDALEQDRADLEQLRLSGHAELAAAYHLAAQTYAEVVTIINRSAR